MTGPQFDRPLVLHVLEAIEGGTARHVTDVVTHTPAVRHAVAIPRRRVGGVTDEAAAGRMEAAGAQVEFVEMRRALVSPRNGAALVAVRRLAARLQPDLVHGHSSVGGALGRLLVARAVRFYTPNGFHPSPVLRAAERALAPLTDVLIAVSASEAAELRAAGVARWARLETIPNGIDLTAAAGGGPDLRAMFGLAPGTPLVGTIARLTHQKAPERFVALGACLAPEVHMVLIGSGPLEPRIDAMGAELGGRFHRIPVLPDAWRILDQLSVFVLLSRFEGAPYTPLEAMRAGTPVVLSDVVGNRDVGGVLVPEEDIGAAARAVAHALAAPERPAALDRFDVRTMGARLGDLYLDALQSTKVR